MINVSNLKIDFKKISSKQNLKKNEVNVLFLDNFKEIKFKPMWLNNEIEKFLTYNSKSRKIKQPYLFETQFGLFLIIPILKKTNDYTLDIENQSLYINYINPTNQNRLNLIMKLHNEGWSNKEIVTFLNLNGIKRRNKKDDYKVKDIFMCLKKLKIREKRKSNIKYKLGKWELWREY